MRITAANIKLPIDHTYEDLERAYARSLKIPAGDFKDLKIRHRSVDARDKDAIRYVYTLDAVVKGGEKLLKDRRLKNVSEYQKKEYEIPENKTYKTRPVIVGAGPAGLFCAYLSVLCGMKPIILERGCDVDTRRKNVDLFWETGKLNSECNVQFGEGGAGTFSDGKLNTLVKDRNGRCTFVMETFAAFGAPEAILYDAKPHVGTDIISDVVKNIRTFICENGGEIRFDSRVESLLYSEGAVTGVRLSTGEEIYSRAVVLAVGHSARDTFEMLTRTGIKMDPKPFALGFRVEHPRSFIDISQYGEEGSRILPAAAYKLTASSENGRGVYTFCMCPGGYVVNASSEEGRIAVNGMSYSGRNGMNSNSAIVVTVGPEDFEDKSVLGGMLFQRRLEEKAYILGGGRVPVQNYGEYVSSMNRVLKSDYRASDMTFNSQYPEFTPQIKGGYTRTDLSGLLPVTIGESLIQGMGRFGKMIRGFDCGEAFLAGIESRTSSPVRIWRDENGESIGLSGLYPCGEGAGYAGGITSAAMDGLFIAEQLSRLD